MARSRQPRPRFFDNPRAYCAGSSLRPLVWLSYLLPARRASLRDDRPIPSAQSDIEMFPPDVPVVTTSRKISLLPSLAAFARRWVDWRWPWEIGQGQIVVGWGYRKSGRRALACSLRRGGEFVLLEDAFLRSVGRNDPAIGLNLDDGGIYYDSGSQSRLFALARRTLTPAETARSRNAIELWRRLGLSKYNGTRDYEGSLPSRYVLVVDQVRKDLSLVHGRAEAASFDRMLAAALEYDPNVSVVVKIHPDSTSNPAKRHFEPQKLSAHPRIQVIADDSHVSRLIERSEAVFAVTSQVGFEALLHEKPVRVFGMPFYAGWGLTTDMLDRPAGRTDIPLEQLVHAALLAYPRYFNPVSNQEVDFIDAARLIGRNRTLMSEWPRVVHAYGFSPWKRPFIRDFLTGSELRFVSSLNRLPPDATLLVWGKKPGPVDRPDITVLRIEDGFLRSSGLGADLVRPLSLVIDDRGIYYDASEPSRLEEILETRDFDDTERERASALRRTIVAQRLSKYNLGGPEWHRPAGGRSVILVVGQVEDDASVCHGSPIKSNVELLRRVRAERPGAYLLYKPHPDVVAGLRVQEKGAEEIATLCDEIIPHADPVGLLEQVDALHTMTSLMGFEALLRGKEVTCHGLPFYAGWGLTDDRVPCGRRTRRRTLDELVHAALIDYPRYFSPRGHLFAEPEDILVELSDLAAAGPVGRSVFRQALRPVLSGLKKIGSRVN